MKKTVFLFLSIVILLSSCTTAGTFYATRRGGRLLEVKLNGNPTTGYQWVSSAVGDSVEEVSSEYQARTKSGMVGVGGTYTFTYRPLVDGETTLHFSYLRAWEKDVPPMEEKTLTVSVEKGKMKVSEL